MLAPMTDAEQRLAAARFQLALDLHEAGVLLMRQNLRRRHPSDSEKEIDARVEAWLLHRPGAEHGDAEGRPMAWPQTNPG